MPADIDTLLSLAREVGATWLDEGDDRLCLTFSQLAAFAERIRQDERERAAQICEKWAWREVRGETRGTMRSKAEQDRATAAYLSAAIRSSGTSQSNPLLGGGNG